MEKVVKIVLHKSPGGSYALTAIPLLINVASGITHSSVEPAPGTEPPKDEDVVLTWILQERSDNPGQPNATELRIEFDGDSPFLNDTGKYSIPASTTDGSARISTGPISFNQGIVDEDLFKYNIFVKVKDRPIEIKLDPHVRARTRTVRPGLLTD